MILTGVELEVRYNNTEESVLDYKRKAIMYSLKARRTSRSAHALGALREINDLSLR